MDWSGIATVADLLAAVGVIATLVFVAYEVRQNTRTVANTHWEAYLGRLSDAFSRTLDPEVAAVVEKGGDSFDALGVADRLVYSAWANEYFLSVSLLLTYRDQSVLGSSATETAERRLAWFFEMPGNLQWWRHGRRHPVPRAVEARVEEWLARHHPA